MTDDNDRCPGYGAERVPGSDRWECDSFDAAAGPVWSPECLIRRLTNISAQLDTLCASRGLLAGAGVVPSTQVHALETYIAELEKENEALRKAQQIDQQQCDDMTADALGMAGRVAELEAKLLAQRDDIAALRQEAGALKRKGDQHDTHR